MQHIKSAGYLHVDENLITSCSSQFAKVTGAEFTCAEVDYGGLPST